MLQGVSATWLFHRICTLRSRPMVYATMASASAAATCRRSVVCAGYVLSVHTTARPGRSRSVRACHAMLQPQQAAAYKARVQQMFDTGATRYNGKSSQEFHEPLALALVDRCGIRTGESVLDLASGTGFASIPAASLVGPTGSVTALDLSAGMLEQQKHMLAALGITNVELVQGDVETVDLKPATYDLVMCCSSLPYFNEIPLVLRRCKDWLKPQPGSRLAFQCYEAPMNPDYGLLCSMAAEQGINLLEPNIRCGSRQACEQLCTAAGFKVTQFSSERLTKLDAASSISQYAELMWARAVRSPFWPVEHPEDAPDVKALKQAYTEAVACAAAGRFVADSQQTGVWYDYVSMYVVAEPVL